MQYCSFCGVQHARYGLWFKAGSRALSVVYVDEPRAHVKALMCKNVQKCANGVYVSDVKRKRKPRGKPFQEGDDTRRNIGGILTEKRKIAEAANACNSIFFEEMFKEVEVLIGGNPTRRRIIGCSSSSSYRPASRATRPRRNWCWIL